MLKPCLLAYLKQEIKNNKNTTKNVIKTEHVPMLRNIELNSFLILTTRAFVQTYTYVSNKYLPTRSIHILLP